MMINTNAHNVRILLLLVQPICVSPSLICPDITYLGVPVQLICTGGTVAHRYYNTSGVEVVRCGLIVGSCEPNNSAAYVISANQTALNIASVQISDAGKWTCKHGLNSNQSCNLTIANIPTYNITSDSATDAVDVYDRVSLTVDIRGFYCSAAHNITLQVGSVTQPLNMYLPEAVTEPTNMNFTIPINVTESHFGGVELIFICKGHQLNVSHRSITQLQQNDSTKVTETKTAAVPGNDGLATASTPIIAASVVGVIVCFINAVIIIMFLVKRKQVTRIKAQASVKPSSPPYINVGAPGISSYATVELNDAPSGSKNITVIDAEGYACAGDFKAKNRSSSLTKDESHKLSLAATSTDNPKNDLGVIVQHTISEDNKSQINELYASINKTKDMTVHNDETAI